MRLTDEQGIQLLEAMRQMDSHDLKILTSNCLYELMERDISHSDYLIPSLAVAMFHPPPEQPKHFLLSSLADEVMRLSKAAKK